MCNLNLLLTIFYITSSWAMESISDLQRGDRERRSQRVVYSSQGNEKSNFFDKLGNNQDHDIYKFFNQQVFVHFSMVSIRKRESIISYLKELSPSDPIVEKWDSVKASILKQKHLTGLQQEMYRLTTFIVDSDIIRAVNEDQQDIIEKLENCRGLTYNPKKESLVDDGLDYKEEKSFFRNIQQGYFKNLVSLSSRSDFFTTISYGATQLLVKCTQDGHFNRLTSLKLNNYRICSSLLSAIVLGNLPSLKLLNLSKLSSQEMILFLESVKADKFPKLTSLDLEYGLRLGLSEEEFLCWLSFSEEKRNILLADLKKTHPQVKILLHQSLKWDELDSTPALSRMDSRGDKNHND